MILHKSHRSVHGFAVLWFPRNLLSCRKKLILGKKHDFLQFFDETVLFFMQLRLYQLYRHFNANQLQLLHKFQNNVMFSAQCDGQLLRSSLSVD